MKRMTVFSIRTSTRCFLLGMPIFIGSSCIVFDGVKSFYGIPIGAFDTIHENVSKALILLDFNGVYL